MKKLLVLLAMALILAGCGSGGTEQPSGTDDWATANGLYEDESMDDLYAKAKEEGALTIYTISSRTQTIAEYFMEDYPGITVDVKDISASDLKQQYVTEYEAGVRNVDILHSKEVTGDYIMELFKDGSLHTYRPASIFGNVQGYEDYAPLMLELNVWFYNTEVYSEAPFTSLWALTTEEWRGRCVFQDPVENVAYSAFLTAMCEHPDEMAADYKAYFGEDIVLAEDEPDASHAWIKRFIANDPILADGSDEVIDLVSASGQTNPPVGYASSVKLRGAIKDNLPIAMNADVITPATGIPVVNFLAIADECPHPNAAKLFIKYWMGGEDGQGRGYEPLATAGSYSVRPENPSYEGNVPLSDINLWEPDFNYIYANVNDVVDYWTIHR
jgi:iron(III) transport system substrate-binding protein